MRPELAALLNSAVAAEVLALVGTGERLFALSVDHLGREARTDAPAAPQSIAVLRLEGSLFPRGSGQGSMEAFRSRLNAAANNPDIGAIVLDINSPGGTVRGTPETANAVRAAAQVKPVVAIADGLAASAAYYIASQASQLWIAPSGEVGSIGVMALHLDLSQALQDAGITPTLITSSNATYKGEGNPLQPLSEDARDYTQAEVDREEQAFIRAVAQGRKVTPEQVASSFGKGRTVAAEEAVRLGMADRVGTMAEVLASLRTKSGAVRRRSALAFV